MIASLPHRRVKSGTSILHRVIQPQKVVQLWPCLPHRIRGKWAKGIKIPFWWPIQTDYGRSHSYLSICLSRRPPSSANATSEITRGVVPSRHLRHVPPPPDSVATLVNSLQNRVKVRKFECKHLENSPCDTAFRLNGCFIKKINPAEQKNLYSD